MINERLSSFLPSLILFSFSNRFCLLGVSGVGRVHTLGCLQVTDRDTTRLLGNDERGMGRSLLPEH